MQIKSFIQFSPLLYQFTQLISKQYFYHIKNKVPNKEIEQQTTYILLLMVKEAITALYIFQIKMEKLLLMGITQSLKVVLVKREYINRNGWLHAINYGLAILSLIYLTITNSVVNPHNFIFHYLETLDAFLDRYPTPSFVLSQILLALSLNILITSLILMNMRFIKQKKQNQIKRQDNLKAYLAISLILFQILIVPLVVFQILYLSVSNWILYVCDIALSFAITLVFRANILYKECFFIIIVSAHLFSTELFPLCLIIISLFAMLKRDTASAPFYLQILGVSFIVFINANFNVDISIFHLLIAVVSIPAIVIFMPYSQTYLTSHWNEHLLAAINKTSKGQPLSNSLLQQVYTILHYIQKEKDKYDLAVDNQYLHTLYEEVNKDNIAALLRSKISLDKLINPNNLLLEIQLSQGEIYTNRFSISMLTRVQTVNRAVEQMGDFQLRLRMMRLIHKLEHQHLLKEQKVSPTSIIQVEKCIELFYTKIDQVLALYISVWKEKTKKCFQKVLIKKISKLCRAQSQCIQLLTTINKYKEAVLQNLVFNYIQKRFGLSDIDQFHAVKPQRYLQFQSSKFILVYNELIVDISQQFTNQIQTNKSFLINGTIFTIIPREFHQYFRSHINNWLNNRQNDRQIIIPFKYNNNQNVFVPFVCSFKIFAEIQGGIKYLIHIQKSYESRVEYFLMYSLNEDKITMLSKTFCQQYRSFQQLNKLGQFLLSAEELLGVDLSFLSERSKQDSSQQILCEINLKRFQRKTTQKKVSKHHFFNLKLAQIYELQNNRVFMLSIIPKHQSQRNRTINQFIVNQNRKLNTYMHKSQDDINQTRTFCSIKNPLKDLIQQRLNKKSSFPHNSYLLRSFLISTFIFVLAFVGYMQYNVSINGSVDGAADKINNYVLQMSKFQKIYLLFFQYYIYIHSLKYPEHYLAVSPNLNVSKLQKGYGAKVAKSVNTILGMSIDSSVELRVTSYKLQYGIYQIGSQTSVMTLLPLLEDIKLSITNNQFLFTLQNSQLVDLYTESLLPIDTNIIRAITNQQFDVLIIISSLLLLAVIALKIQYIKIRCVIWDILDIYDKLNEDQVYQQLQNLNKFKSLLTRNKSKAEQASYTVSVSESRPTIKQTYLQLILHHNIYLFIIVASSVLLYYYCFYSLDSYGGDVEALVEYAAALQLISKVNTYSPQRYYQAGVQELLSPDRRVIIDQINMLTIPNLYPSKLPSFFDTYIQQSAEIMKIDICNSPKIISKINADLMFSKMDCSKVMFSQLSNGFFEAFPFIIGEINKRTGKLMSNFKDIYGEASIYPFFAQVLYSRKALDIIIEMIGGLFQDSVSVFLLQRRKAFDFIIILALFTMIAILVSIGLYLSHIAKLSQITKKSFNLLPRKFIYSIKASKALIRSGLLSKIQMVSI